VHVLLDPWGRIRAKKVGEERWGEGLEGCGGGRWGDGERAREGSGAEWFKRGQGWRSVCASTPNRIGGRLDTKHDK
jgi:hypothetical protein